MFNNKFAEYREKQVELEAKIAQYRNADDSFYLNAEMLLHALKKAAEVFEGSEATTKRQILNFLLTNCTFDGKKFKFELKTPFNRVIEANSRSNMLPIVNDVRTNHPTTTDTILYS